MTTNKLCRYTILIICIIIGSLIFGCTDRYMDYNENKHQASEEMMSWDNLKTGSFFAQLQRNVVMFKDGINSSSAGWAAGASATVSPPQPPK